MSAHCIPKKRNTGPSLDKALVDLGKDWDQDDEIKRLRQYAESLEEDAANAKSLSDRREKRQARYGIAIVRMHAALTAIVALRKTHPKCRDAHSAVAIAEKALKVDGDLVLYGEASGANRPDAIEVWDWSPGGGAKKVGILERGRRPEVAPPSCQPEPDTAPEWDGLPTPQPLSKEAARKRLDTQARNNR